MTTKTSPIRFKPRKKIFKKCKEFDENIDVSNIADNTMKRRVLKRLINDDFKKDDTAVLTKVPKTCRKNNEDVNSTANSDEISTERLTCREEEIEWLENILTEHAESEKSVSLYISGQPGTGKTESLSHILRLPKIKEMYKQVYINCNQLKSAANVYAAVCKKLDLRVSPITEKNCYTAIETYLRKKHKLILLVLDEIDKLENKQKSVLYKIFEWPSMEGSRLVLIGIANALDLTERLLPRLRGRGSLRPQSLPFAPYTKEQIVKIFTSVLAKEDKTNIFSPVALQMLAAKIAALNGDMRRALDIGRRVMELAKRNKFSDKTSIDTVMSDPTVTVELKEVLKVLQDVYGGARKIDTDVDEGFPMQHKLILGSLLLMLTKGKTQDIVMWKLHEVYKKVANARNIGALDISEMGIACSLLESRGAIRLSGSGGPSGMRGCKLRLLWNEADLMAALEDKPLLSSILTDLSCLPSRH